MNLWDPGHVNLTADLLTAFLLGLVHGITPDEHTWPITFSYAVGSYSTGRGLRAGLIFSAAFTVQQALASELAHLGLAHWFTFDAFDGVVYIIVGIVMAAGGLYVTGTGSLPHLHMPGLDRLHGHAHGHSPGPHSSGPYPPGPHPPGPHPPGPRELKPWMPAVHGFIAGWGLDAFSAIIYTTLAPAMPSAAIGWLPGLLFGIGTLIVQAIAGAAFGLWAARRNLPATAIRAISLITAARTLTWGGIAFFLFGVFSLVFPEAADVTIDTPLHVHNLDSLGLPFLLVIFTVLGIGVTTFVGATRAFHRAALAADSAS